MSPWHWYFTSALPRSLLAGFALLPLGGLRWNFSRPGEPCSVLRTFIPEGLDWAVLEFALPALVFVTLYSKLPHKELRFLLPALPLFHLLAGSGLAKVFSIAHALVDPTPVRDAGADDLSSAASSVSCAITSEGSSKVRRRVGIASPAVSSDHAVAAPTSARKDRALGRALGASLAVCVFTALAGSALGTVVFVRVAMDNYPGGVGLQRMYSLQELATCRSDVVSTGISEQWRVCFASSGTACAAVFPVPRPLCSRAQWPRAVTVHVDVAAAVSGVSRFAESWSGAWTVNKTEGMTDANVYASAFDWLLTETPQLHATAFETVEAVPAFSRIDWRGGALVERTPALYIMRRRTA